MDAKDLKKGTRIYYGGDQANEEGLGVITRRITDQFGTYVDIRMDDKRFLPLISVTAFSDKYLGHGGTRFVTEEAYKDFRQDQIDKVEATLAQKDAKRSERKKTASDIEWEKYSPNCPDKPSLDHTECRVCKEAKICKTLLKTVSDDELDGMLEDASREAEKRGESDKRELYEVWKDDTVYGGPKWKVQMKYGVSSYRTKRAAVKSAKAWKKANAEAKPPPARVKKEALKSKEAKLMRSLKALELGLEYGAKLAVEKQLIERKKGGTGEFDCGRARAYKEAAGDLNRIIKKEGLI